jgi:cytosine/creatinine deaminase
VRFELVVHEGRLRDGRVVDLGIRDGRLDAISDEPLEGERTLAAEGRLVTESFFVDAHLHLDKVHSLPRVGDEALDAYTGGSMGAAMTAIELAREVKQDYDRSWIALNVTRALRESVRLGILHIQAFVDVDTTGGLEGLHGVLDALPGFAGVLNVQLVAFPQNGVVRDPGAADLVEEAVELGAQVVGGSRGSSTPTATLAATSSGRASWRRVPAVGWRC